MNIFDVKNGSCVDQNVEVIVNAANRYLMSGGGVCGAIFKKKAGYNELNEACSKYNTLLKDGDAVITPAFNIKNAKYIIHAVGPDFGKNSNAFNQLFDAYYNSLVLMKDNNLYTIAFPLISSGIFRGNLDNPVEVSTKQYKKVYNKFLNMFPDYKIKVFLCAYTKEEYDIAYKIIEDEFPVLEMLKDNNIDIN